MRKILIFLIILILTGCKDQIECTKKEQGEEYGVEQKLVFDFDKNNQINNSIVNYTMIFEDEQQAKSYLTIFETLDTNYEIKLKNNKINIVSENDYSQYSQNKDELIIELEENGFSCK